MFRDQQTARQLRQPEGSVKIKINCYSIVHYSLRNQQTSRQLRQPQGSTKINDKNKTG